MALCSVLCAASYQAGERDASGIRFMHGPLRGLLPGCFKSSLGCYTDKMSCYLFVKPTQEGRIEIPPIMNSKRTLKICRQQGRISGIYPYPSSLPTVVSFCQRRQQQPLLPSRRWQSKTLMICVIDESFPHN